MAVPSLRAGFPAGGSAFALCGLPFAAELAGRPGADAEEAQRRVERWLEVAPLDRRARQAMLAVLLRAGRIREGEERLAVAIRGLEEEGLDWSPLREWWQASKSKAPPRPGRVETATSPEPRLGPSLESGRERARRETAQRRLASVAIMPFGDAGPLSGEAGQLARVSRATRLPRSTRWTR